MGNGKWKIYHQQQQQQQQQGINSPQKISSRAIWESVDQSVLHKETKLMKESRKRIKNVETSLY